MVYHADSIKYFHSMSVHDVKYIFSQSHRLVCQLRFPLFLGNFVQFDSNIRNHINFPFIEHYKRLIPINKVVRSILLLEFLTPFDNDPEDCGIFDGDIPK